jgi:4-amino-4-deoxychorismate lyase
MDSDNYVIEGTMSNIFCITGTTLFTPDLSLCGIDGLVRKKIIDLSDKLKFSIEIKNITHEFLLDAEEVFMCNSLIGIWPVNSIDEKLFSNYQQTTKISNNLIKYNFIPNYDKK